MDSEKNYCLITGASNGIGKALAEECTNRKLNLFLVALPESGLEELSKHLAKINGNDIQCLSIDLTEMDAPKKVYNYAKTNNLIIDKIINNAGVGGFGEMADQKESEVDTMIMLNIRATTLLTYYFLNDLKKLPHAYILNISSFGAFVPIPKKSLYAATKSYILFFSRALNTELKGTNITVSSVHPSGVATNPRLKKSMQKASMVAKITTLDSSEVAKIAIDGMIKNKKLIVPGIATQFFYIVGLMLPHGIVLRIIRKVFSKNS
ncbi:MAG: SDR family NAD(P)-dependent oxidoreductase [Mariniphaga sp.]|nr:SDR family NAD(P)-dependent oxidoreductase [Mariniphaga sp.]